MSTPLVADFNFDDHKSSEFPTIHPSIVINTYNNPSDGSCGLGPDGDKTAWGILRVLDGRSCKLQYNIPTRVVGSITPAIGDLKGDGRPEIVAYTWESSTTPSGVVALTFDGRTSTWVELWRSHDAGGTAHRMLPACEWAGPSIADLDNDGKPEVLAEGFVYSNTGQLIDGSLGSLSAGYGQFAVVADIDKDGVPNLVTPNAAYAWNKAMSRWESKYTYPATTGINYIAVGDFGTVNGTTLDRSTRDGFAEIVVVGTAKVSMLSYDGKVIFGPLTIPSATTNWGGGPPTVGDFDNDGRAEFAAAGADSYQVFDPDCITGADPKFCPTATTNQILWTKFSQDKSSRVTGSSGVPGNGKTCQAAHTANRTGIRVFGDGLDRWVGSRPMWNQHAYSITNVTDDGNIPATSAVMRNWEQPGLNNFRLNVQGKLAPSSTPDATAQGKGSASAECMNGMAALSTSVCNRGSAPVGDGLPVTFYEGASVLCIATTTQALPPGKCIQVRCTAPSVSSGPHEVIISADDDGTGKAPASECNSGNNKASMSFSC